MTHARKLLVLAENHVAESVSRSLKPDPVELYRSGSMPDAVASAVGERPDMVLFDADLPGIDIMRCSAAFRAHDSLRDIPIIALSSSGKAFGESFLMEGACDDFLHNYQEGNVLLAKLRHYISCSNRFARVPFCTQVTIRDNDGTYYGVTGDISCKGIFVATFDKLPAESEIELHFTLQGDDSARIVTCGRVAWMNSRNTPRNLSLPEGFGVEFKDIPCEKTSAIMKLVRAKNSRALRGE